MDSNFQVKISADISELEKSIGRVNAALGNIDKTSKSSNSSLVSSTRAATEATEALGNSIKNVEANANRGRMVAFAFGQVIRDTGFFAQSTSLGVLAISNNIPILIDQLSLAIPALSGVSGAISLLGSFLTAGLTIWSYQAAATERAAKKGQDYIETLNALSRASLQGKQNAQEQVVQLDLLYSATQNLTLSNRERLKAVNELQNQYPGYFANLSDESILAGKAENAYRSLRDALIQVAEARAAQDLLVENAKKRLENEQKIADLEAQRVKQEERRNRLAAEYGGQQTALNAEAISSSDYLLNSQKQLTQTISEINRLKKENNVLNEKDAQLVDKIKTTTKSIGVVSIFGDVGSVKKEDVFPSWMGKESEIVDERMKSVTAAINAYRQALLDIEKTPQIKPFDVKKQSIEALGDLITKLKSIDGTEETVAKLTQKFNELNLSLGGLQFGIPLFKIIPEAIKRAKEESAKQLDEFLAKTDSILVGGLGSTIGAAGEALGQALATGGDAAKALGNAILASIGGVLSQFGDLLISAALAGATFSAAFKKLFDTKMWGLALAAGVALKVAAGALRGFTSSKSGGGGGGGDMKSSGSTQSVIPFANGGIVSGPTPALVGEYPGARSNPEVIAPLDKLQGIIAGSMGGGMAPASLETRISGNDLVILMNRATKNRKSYF